MSQLYVGNLSSEATERHVQDVFSQYGAVKEVILKSGFAFVEMEDPASTRLAKNELNGKTFMGAAIIVESSRQQRLSSQRPRQLRVHLGKVILSNIPDNLIWAKLEALVSSLCKVISEDILETSETGLVRSAAFYMDTIEEAQKVANFFKESSMCVSLGSEAPQSILSPIYTPTLRQKQVLSAPSSPTKLNSNSEYPLRILVPSDMVGAIIGKDGNTIRNITQMTKARVDVHRRENIRGLEKAITIIGTPDACTEAAYQIGLIIQKEIIASSNLEAILFGESDTLPTIPLKILAHNELVGRVIGKNGQTLKKIMAETETKIIISKIKDLNDTNPERTITVLGSLENCKHAESMISQKLRASYESDMAQFIPQTHGVPDNIGLLHQQQRCLPYSPQNGSSQIDPYSSSTPSSPIQEQNFGFDTAQYETMIEIPKDALSSIAEQEPVISTLTSPIIKVIPSETEMEENYVSIIGNMDAQATAQKYIFTKVAQEGYGNGNDTVLTVDMFVPALLINKLTAQIQQLQNHTGALIEIPRDVADQRSVVPLRILGNYQSSQAAQKKICSMLMHVAKLLENSTYIQQQQQQHQTQQGSYLTSGYHSNSNTFEVHPSKDSSVYTPGTSGNGSLIHSLSYDYGNLTSRMTSTPSEYSPISTVSSASRRSSWSFDFQSSCSTPELHNNQILLECISPERYHSPVHSSTNNLQLSQGIYKDSTTKLGSGFQQVTPIISSEAEPSPIVSSVQCNHTGINRIRSTPQLPTIKNGFSCFTFGASSPFNQRASASHNESSDSFSPNWNGTGQGNSSPIAIASPKAFSESSESVLTPEEEKVKFLKHFSAFEDNDVFQDNGLLLREIEKIEQSKTYFPDTHLDAQLVSNLTRLTTCESPELVTA